MNTLTLIFVFLLLFIGVLGGGFSTREFKLPRASTGMRFTALVVAGLVFALSRPGFRQPNDEFSFEQPNFEQPNVEPFFEEPGTEPFFEEPSTTSFNLTNTLTQGALREEVYISINGEEIGPLTSSFENPTSTVEFVIIESGMYDYFLELYGFYNNNGQEATFYGQGSGLIDIAPGDEFEVQRELIEGQLSLTLVEK